MLHSGAVICILSAVKQNGFTALKIAAEEGHHECLSILLAHGAEARDVSVGRVCRQGGYACLSHGFGFMFSISAITIKMYFNFLSSALMTRVALLS